MRTRSCGPAPPWPTRVSTTYEKEVSLSFDMTLKQRYKLRFGVYREGHVAMAVAAPATEQLWFLNTLHTVRVRHDQGEDGISVLETLAPHGDSPPLHVHRTEDELFHVLEGELRMRAGDAEIMVCAGESLLAPKGVAHTY